jgi:hypothetical protein
MFIYMLQGGIVSGTADRESIGLFLAFTFSSSSGTFRILYSNRSITDESVCMYFVYVDDVRA